jgi:hypothetical protein
MMVVRGRAPAGSRRRVATMLAMALVAALRLESATGLRSRQQSTMGCEAGSEPCGVSVEELETHLTLHAHRSIRAAFPVRLSLRAQGIVGGDMRVGHHSWAGWRLHEGRSTVATGEHQTAVDRQSTSRLRHHVSFPGSWLEAVTAALLSAFPLAVVICRIAELSLQTVFGVGTRARGEDDAHSIRPPSVWEDTSVRRRRKKRRRRTGVCFHIVFSSGQIDRRNLPSGGDTSRLGCGGGNISSAQRRNKPCFVEPSLHFLLRTPG